MLANARMPVKFERIFINDSLQVTAGRIEMLTRGVQAMAEEQLAAQKKRQEEKAAEEQAEKTADQPALPELIIPVVSTIEEIYINDQQQIVVTDSEGNEQVLDREKDPETGDYVPVQVVDDAGNTYVVDADGKVEKVEGGSDSGQIEIDEISRSFIIIALNQLKEESEQYLELNPFEEANSDLGSPIVSGKETDNELPHFSTISSKGTDTGILQNISTDLNQKYYLALNHQLNNIIIQIANSPDFFIAKISQFKDDGGFTLINQINTKKESMDENDIINYIKEQIKNNLQNTALAILDQNN